MQAEIIVIGTEILLGEIVDTNAAYLAQQLASIGLNLYRKTTVGDNEGRLAAAIREALARSEVVITSGGLGPTVDDVTREAVAHATGRPLVMHQELLVPIREIFARRGMTMSPNNEKQAMIPEGAIAIPNPVGTAPAFIVEQDGHVVISLPGVPRELKHLFETAVIRYLRQRFDLRGIIPSRALRISGMPESQVDALLGELTRASNPTIGLLARPGEIEVRLTAKANDEAAARAMLDAREAEVRQRLGQAIFGVDADSLESVVVAALCRRGWRLALLETNTGGAVARRLMAVPGGPTMLSEALVSCDAMVIARWLGLSDPSASLRAEALKAEDSEHRIVLDPPSPEVATRLAESLRSITAADVALALVGTLVGDPYAEHTGITHAALALPGETKQDQFRLGGTSVLVQNWVTNLALDFVRRAI